jgi:uncharacterized protein
MSKRGTPVLHSGFVIRHSRVIRASSLDILLGVGTVLIASLLFLVGLVAGCVDAIAGGGGLLTVPALRMALGGVPAFAGRAPQLALGTNKGQGVFGTATSLGKFLFSPLLDRKRAAQSFVPALVGGVVGVSVVARIPPKVLDPLIMALLAVAAALVIFQRPPSRQLASRTRPMWMAAAVGFSLAFYDGFFGPGTGTFLILAYTYLWHDPLDAASANAKVVNFASNLAAMVTFASRKLIVWKFALPMAAGQIIGGYIGAHVTIRGGRGVVRYVVVAVAIALIVKLGWGLI